jgi:hypothetical protein
MLAVAVGFPANIQYIKIARAVKETILGIVVAMERYTMFFCMVRY